MSDDLVKWLRDCEDRLGDNAPCAGKYAAAADRIEALEGYKTEMAKLITSTANANEQLWRRTAKTRREALEEAARVAEKTTAYDDNLQKSAGCLTTGQRIAAAIRALKEEE